jgi:hypothetical protein
VAAGSGGQEENPGEIGSGAWLASCVQTRMRPNSNKNCHKKILISMAFVKIISLRARPERILMEVPPHTSRRAPVVPGRRGGLPIPA